MNQLKKCTAIKSALLLTALCAATVVQAADVATVTQLSGPLLAQKANGSVRVLANKSAIEAGDTLSTQSKSYAQIKFSDGSTLILQPDTVLTIDKFAYDAAKPSADSATFTLGRGMLRANAGLLGKRSKDAAQIVTPAATISLQAANVVVRYVAASAEAVAAARQAYLLASTAALDSAMQATRSDMPAPAAIQPLLLAQLNIPLPTGVTPNAVGLTPPLPPGLYIQVIDGLISVANRAGTQSFAPGQFGFTPSPITRPELVPKNPGLQFTVPPVFNPTSTRPGMDVAAPSNSNTIDCEVR